MIFIATCGSLVSMRGNGRPATHPSSESPSGVSFTCDEYFSVASTKAFRRLTFWVSTMVIGQPCWTSQNIAGGRVMLNGWPGLARENLESGQDLKVTLDHRDILAEIVKNRLANPNLSVVFPDYVPTMRGVTR